MKDSGYFELIGTGIDIIPDKVFRDPPVIGFHMINPTIEESRAEHTYGFHHERETDVKTLSVDGVVIAELTEDDKIIYKQSDDKRRWNITIKRFKVGK